MNTDVCLSRSNTECVEKSVRFETAESHVIRVELAGHSKFMKVTYGDMQSMSLLQTSVSHLGGEGENFVFQDSDGKGIMTDEDLEVCLARGKVPICASFSDASIQAMERKRNDVVHMQWRQHVAPISDKFKLFDTQIQEFKAELAQHTLDFKVETCNQRLATQSVQESMLTAASAAGAALSKVVALGVEQRLATQTLEQSMRAELHSAIEREAANNRTEIAAVMQRMDYILQAFQDEQSKSEKILVKQQQHSGKQFETIKNLLDADKNERIAEVARVKQDVESLSQALRIEGQDRENVAKQYTSDLSAVQTQCEHLACMMQEDCQSKSELLSQLVSDFNSKQKDLEERLMETQEDVRVSKEDSVNRIEAVDEHCNSQYQEFVSDLAAKHQELEKWLVEATEDLRGSLGERVMQEIQTTRVKLESHLEMVEKKADEKLEDMEKIIKSLGKGPLSEVTDLKRANSQFDLQSKERKGSSRLEPQSKESSTDKGIALTPELTPACLSPGSKWLHYKHTEASPMRYEVLHIAKYAETEEDLVLYRALYGERLVWARPLSMWHELVTVNQPWPDGEEQTRPRFIEDKLGSVSIESPSRDASAGKVMMPPLTTSSSCGDWSRLFN